MLHRGNRYRRTPKSTPAGLGRAVRSAALFAGALVAVVLMGAVLAHAYSALRTLPWPSVKEVSIVGNERVSNGGIIEAMGVRRGSSVLALRLPVLQRRVEVLPWVESATVRLNTTGGLEVEVAERVPVAVTHVDNVAFLADRSGTLFMEAGQATSRGLVTVLGYTRGDVTPEGALRPEVFSRLTELLEVLPAAVRALPDFKMGVCVWEGSRGFLIRCQIGGRELAVQLGGGDFRRGLARLRGIVTALNTRGLWDKVEGVDLDYTRRGYVTGQF